MLQLGYNCVTDIAALGLERLPELKVLYLQGNEITHVTGLEGCHALRELVLDKNKIKAIEPGSFVGLTQLQELRIQENGLRNLNGLQMLVSVQVLALSYNRLAETADLERLASLPHVTELWLVNNPIARKQLYRAATIRRMPWLRLLDGKEVTADELDRSEVCAWVCAPLPPTRFAL